MKYGIIGIGNLGTALVVNMDYKGLEIGGIYSRNNESIENVNSIINVNHKNSFEKVITNSDIIFITVPDDEISIIDKLISKDFTSSQIERKTFVHMSGIKTSDTLKNIRNCGGIVGSLHPIQTFPDRSGNREAFTSISCGFEGDEKVLLNLKFFFDVFNINIIKIKKDKKALYHASSVILCNMMSTIAYMGEKVFENIGIENEYGYNAFKPLMERTLKNILTKGAVNSLSGPVTRGDIETIDSHIKIIRKKIPEISASYEALTEITAKMALEKGTISIDKYNDLIESLKSLKKG